MMDDIVIFTGGFDPIHSGHISCIKEARKLGRIVIGLNSDEWLIRKKGKPFLTFEERKAVLDEFKQVLCVIPFDDSDNTASDAIRQVRKLFPTNKIIFVNGGDRTEGNIPELEAFKNCPHVSFKFGIGGENKKNSSSTILSDWKHPTEKRVWGDSMTYYDSKESKVKRLILEPGKSISMQYHLERSEFWFVESGSGTIYTHSEGNTIKVKNIYKHEMHHVPVGEWHKLEAGTDEKLCIIEIQYGKLCDEKDIVRL
jgi:D-beta-D-heptose 7-phosphate kinase/D-beta-D-heptose 1-phosphate adenosyltransferase